MCVFASLAGDVPYERVGVGPVDSLHKGDVIRRPEGGQGETRVRVLRAGTLPRRRGVVSRAWLSRTPRAQGPRAAAAYPAGETNILHTHTYTHTHTVW